VTHEVDAVLVRGIPVLIVLAVGCASRIPPYRYTPGAPNGASGSIEISPHATVGDLDAAVRGAFPDSQGCVLSFDATANPIPEGDRFRLVVVSGDLRLPASAFCEHRWLGSVGVIAAVVLSWDERSWGFRWCKNGDVMRISTHGTISSLKHDIERQLLPDRGIALAAWSTDDAYQALGMVERFRAAGVPLILVNEGKAELRSTDRFHGCEPREDPIDG
jgi:hypothetical protein